MLPLAKIAQAAGRGARMESKKISIIVPVFRVEAYLERAVASVLAQTHQNFELILVEDGSPDGSGALCDRLAETDARIRVIHREQNGGAARARETGVLHASGDFIGFLDADDWIEPDLYRTLLCVQARTEADMVECAYFLTHEWGDVPSATGGAVHELDRPGAMRLVHAIKPMHKALWNKLFRRAVVPRVREGEDVILGEDYSLLVHALERCERVAYVETPLYHYVRRADSACNAGYTECHRAALENWRRHRERLSAVYPAIRAEITASLLFNEMSLLAAMTKNKCYDKEAMRIIRRDVRQNLFVALRARNRTPMATGSLLLTAISPRLLTWGYRILFYKTNR